MRETKMMVWLLCLVVLGAVMMNQNNGNVEAVKHIDYGVLDPCRRNGVFLPGCAARSVKRPVNAAHNPRSLAKPRGL